MDIYDFGFQDIAYDEDYYGYNIPTYQTNQKTMKKQIGGTHYLNFKIHPGDFIVRNNIPWFEANAIKYICRHRLKGGKEDLDKAIHYLQMAKDYYYPQN